MEKGTLPRVSWEEIVEHLDHAIKVAGVDHVGLGSDFDGATMPFGMEDASKLPKLTDALRPWTIDFHVAQNDGSVFGSGDHEKTGKHCLATDPRGKLNIVRDSGYWLRDKQGKVTKKMKHICWDGCMFPNEVLMKQQTWNDILSAMIEVRNQHGWVG